MTKLSSIKICQRCGSEFLRFWADDREKLCPDCLDFYNSIGNPSREQEVMDYADLSYSEYLKTPYWKKLRIGVLKRFDNRCSICNSKKNLNIHHRKYGRRGYENESDLIVLCSDCHEVFHKNSRLSDGK